jgi:hypothetical protein
LNKLLAALTFSAVIVLASASAVIAASSVAKKTFGDGTYRVARDVPAGTYRASGGGTCYWARLRSFSGDLDSILANDNARGPALVTILRTDKGFETHGCGRWTSNLGRITKSTTRFGDGQFIVGTDIAPGTYRARGGSTCYWARLSAFTGDLNSILANDNPRGSTIVTISSRDRGFASHGCGTWTR